MSGLCIFLGSLEAILVWQCQRLSQTALCWGLGSEGVEGKVQWNLFSLELIEWCQGEAEVTRPSSVGAFFLPFSLFKLIQSIVFCCPYKYLFWRNPTCAVCSSGTDDLNAKLDRCLSASWEVQQWNFLKLPTRAQMAFRTANYYLKSRRPLVRDKIICHPRKQMLWTGCGHKRTGMFRNPARVSHTLNWCKGKQFELSAGVWRDGMKMFAFATSTRPRNGKGERLPRTLLISEWLLVFCVFFFNACDLPKRILFPKFRDFIQNNQSVLGISEE